ncbi:hypothetical protein P3T76_014772 [Phytophthora citrophthora]|uniref:Uncharacterized protein n=1 Tax=Phytophthora citrophthora TaxID=4793 RepID=A0AAD9LBN6_9STRA|nr:hypothetical protein P3T76_014772 [Phytophthora citrophthora]
MESRTQDAATTRRMDRMMRLLKMLERESQGRRGVIARDTVRHHEIDVSAVETFLCRTLNQWPQVTVMDPDSMAHAAHEVSNGPSCAVCELATCADPDQEPQGVSDMVEHEFPHLGELVFSSLWTASARWSTCSSRCLGLSSAVRGNIGYRHHSLPTPADTVY